MPFQRMEADVVRVAVAGKKHKKWSRFVHLGCTTNIISDVTPMVNRRSSQAWKYLVRYSRAIYDDPYIVLIEKVRFLRAEMSCYYLNRNLRWASSFVPTSLGESVRSTQPLSMYTKVITDAWPGRSYPLTLAR